MVIAIARTIKKSISISKSELFWTFGLTIASVIAPALFAHTPNNQWLTGSLVNATLFLAASRIPFGNAFFVAAMPSTIALMRGLLPAPMAMLIPFIILSNFLLIFAYKKTKFATLPKVIFASLAKFALLYTISLIFAVKLAMPLIQMLQWPQLATAICGGLIAMGFIKITNKS